jgi:hypothetical protein
MSFGSTPTSDGFVKRYELHYQPKMEVDGAILDAQFGCLNFHTKQHKSNVVKLTVVDRLDEGLVLLQGSSACLPSGGKKHTRFALTHECAGVFDGASDQLPQHRHRGCGLHQGH